MRNIKIYVLCLTVLICLASILLVKGNILKDRNEAYCAEIQKENKTKADDFRKKYFKRWHEPYGSLLEAEQLKKMWNEVNSVPREEETFSRTEDWSMIGPFGSLTTTEQYWSGRVLDIHLYTDGKMKIGSSSGGLWTSTDSLPVLMSEGVISPSITSFDIQPGNESVIVLGTGATNLISGTGIWRTSNGGQNWTNITLNPSPPNCYKVRFTPNNQNIVHAATNVGYFRSSDAGLTWTRILDNDVTDIAVNSSNPDLMYIGRKDHPHFGGIGGVFKSTNGGLNWTRLDNNGLPGTNLGKTVVTISSSTPFYAYALVAKLNPSNQVLGVYKTTNYGDNWISVTPTEDIIGGGGTSSTGVIGVSPLNPQIILAGGLWLWRSIDGGISWDKITDQDEPSIHADIHSIAWNSTGNAVCIGHDGGTSFSPNITAHSFTSEKNRWPITEYYNFDIGTNNSMIIFGGSQDNAFTGTTDGGNTWKYTIVGGADGGGIAIDPLNAANIYGSLGAYGGGLLFQRRRSTDFGQNWSSIDNGLSNGTDWTPKVRAGNISPVFIYTHSGSNFYSSLNGDSWSQMNISPFQHEITNFSVRDYAPDHTTVIYACFDSRLNGERLKVKIDNGEFIERTTGIPDSISIRGVAMHPTDENTAIALINGFSAPNKIFMTTNKGLQWANITGNLPNVPMGDLVIHPTLGGTYYLGTEMGCFKTTDGGVNWFRWNQGMSETVIVTEMKSYTVENEFYVLAGTYGRSIWRRKADILTSGGSISGQVPDNFILYQNYPNPFNPGTSIKFSLPGNDNVKLHIYDITGRLVSEIINADLEAGVHEVEFNGSDLSSGVYFYKMVTPRFTEVKKMLLVK